jgi:hypothetical protein
MAAGLNMAGSMSHRNGFVSGGPGGGTIYTVERKD